MAAVAYCRSQHFQPASLLAIALITRSYLNFLPQNGHVLPFHQH